MFFTAATSVHGASAARGSPAADFDADGAHDLDSAYEERLARESDEDDREPSPVPPSPMGIYWPPLSAAKAPTHRRLAGPGRG